MRDLSCASGAQQYVSGPGVPDIDYVTFVLALNQTLTPPVVIRDFFCSFPRPHRFFFVASIDRNYAQSDVYVHFFPLNFNQQNPSLNIVTTGGEPWIPLFDGNNVNGTTVEGKWIKFPRPVQGFYIDVDHPNGGSGPIKITFGATDDIESMVAERL